MSSPAILPHQHDAVGRIVDEDALLCEFGTGTGKTRIIIEVCKVLVSAGDVPILLCVPNSLLEQTYQQFRLWAGEVWTSRHVEILSGNQSIGARRERLCRGNATIYVLAHEAMSYPLIRDGIRYRRWGASLIDEASRFRNHSKRTITLTALGKASRTRYAFTGNLTVRNPADGWYVMNYLRPGLFGTNDRDTFITGYCLLGGYTGMQPIGVRPDRLEKLKSILDPLRISIQLSDIREMPPRSLVVRRVDLLPTQRKAYNQMRDELRAEIKDLSVADFETVASTYAVRLLRLQEIAAGFGRNTDDQVVFLPSPKTEELVRTLVDSPGVPTVIWYWWQPELRVITSRLQREGLTYRVFGHDKDAVAAFMDGTVDLFISQLGRGAYGLNLQRATRMMYHSLPWDLDAYSQSQERNRRLDTPDGVSHEIEHYVVRQTVDEYVRDRLSDKAIMSLQLSRSQALEMLL